jgi:hypothetical protein
MEDNDVYATGRLRVRSLDAGARRKKLLEGLAHSELGRSLGGKEFYSCKRCDETPFMKAQLGHDGKPQGFWDVNLITDEKLTRCPIRLLQLAKSELRDEVLRWKDLYFPLYMKGHLLVTARSPISRRVGSRRCSTSRVCSPGWNPNTSSSTRLRTLNK